MINSVILLYSVTVVLNMICVFSVWAVGVFAPFMPCFSFEPATKFWLWKQQENHTRIPGKKE